jgi:dihydropyrimidine dehydrogenase (NAD+) subunit PreA
MSDLKINMCGIKSPNPFWLASGPPTNTGDQIMRAFDAGWGGAVWKTIGEAPKNVSPRLSAIDCNGKKNLGINNIEVLTNRPIEVNFKEMAEVKKRYPEHAVISSISGSSKNQWVDFVKRSEDSGADGIELNMSCPHGMPERGMCMAIGQNNEAIKEICQLVRGATQLPIMAKLTPAVADIRIPALAAKDAGINGVCVINTIPSIVSFDLDNLIGKPTVNGKFTNGGYSGKAIKPIALYMVASLAREEKFALPISGSGGISDWKDAVEFLALGATSLQICTAVMFNGFGIIDDLVNGLSKFLVSKNMTSVSDLLGISVPNFVKWNELSAKPKSVAQIDADACIGCQKCFISCRDGGHQAITSAKVPVIDAVKCDGCGLCPLVCPKGCIKMKVV